MPINFGDFVVRHGQFRRKISDNRFIVDTGAAGGIFDWHTEAMPILGHGAAMRLKISPSGPTYRDSVYSVDLRADATTDSLVSSLAIMGRMAAKNRARSACGSGRASGSFTVTGSWCTPAILNS